MSKLKNLGVNLGLTLGGLFMGVVIGEMGLRAAKICLLYTSDAADEEFAV